MFKKAIETQCCRQSALALETLRTQYLYLKKKKKKFTLFKAAVGPREFKKEVQICPGPGWQYGK